MLRKSVVVRLSHPVTGSFRPLLAALMNVLYQDEEGGHGPGSPSIQGTVVPPFREWWSLLAALAFRRLHKGIWDLKSLWDLGAKGRP